MKNHSSALPKFKNKSSSSSLRLVLENRLVFDGAALATAVEVHQENAVDSHVTANTPEAAPTPPGEPNVAFVPEARPDAVAYQPNPVDASKQPAFAVDSTLPETSTAPGLNAGSGDMSPPSPAIADPHSAAELSLLSNSPANTPSATLGPERQAFQAQSAPLGEQHNAVDSAQGVILPDAPAAETPREIIFVDARVQDLHAFLAGRSTTEVIVLNPGHDGVEQMATALAGRTGIDAIHILSHGDAGQLYLGDSTLDAHSISGEHADELATIKTALANNADILIYGCDVAAGDQGQAFVTALAMATGADVAASIDSTGSADLGGDWQLESDTGNIEAAALAFTQYQGLLAAPTITDSVIIPRTTAEDVSLAITGITIADTDGNNQTVTLTATNGILTLASTSGLTGLSGNGTGVVAFAGTLAQVNAAINGMTFAPAVNYSGAATIAMSANDGPTTANLPVNITVNPVSDAPMLSVSPASGNEDAGIALTITATLTDPSETLAVTLSAIPAGSTLTNTAGDTLTISAGSITLTSAQLAGLKILPPADYNGSMALTVTATSTEGIASPASVTDTLIVTVLPVNDAPVANADAIAATEDGGPSTGNVLANDVNGDAANGDVLVVSGIRTGTVSGSGTPGSIGNALLGTFGSLTLNANGDYTYTVDNTLDEVQALAAGQTVSDSFTYTVTDGTTPVTAEITVTVTGVNDAPVLVSQPAITLTPLPEDTLDVANTGQLVSSLLVDTASGTTLVTDADAGTVPGIAITRALGGVNGMAGVWQYQLNGSGSWTGFGPVSTTTALLLPADAKVRFVVTENPADDTKEFGAARLSYQAWDGSAGSAGGLVDASALIATAAYSSTTLDATLNVTTVNDAPVLTRQSGSIDENTPLVFSAATLNVTDPDNIPVQIMYKLDVLPAHGDMIKNGLVLGLDSLFSQDDINNGLVSYRYTGVDLGFTGVTDNFTVSVRDGAGGVLTGQVVTLTLTDDNAPITATPTAFTVNERVGSEAADFGIINLNMSDADGDPALMVLTLNSLPDPQVGRLQYWNGTSYVNAALNQAFTQAELTAHPLHFISTGAEPVGALASTTFNVTANDTRGSTDTKTITVNIAPVNDLPDALVPAPIFSVNQGSPLNTITNSYLNLSDADSNTATKITYTLNTLPALGAVYYVKGGQNLQLGAGAKFTQADINAGFIRYTHFGATPADANFNTAEDHFGYTLSDGDGGFKTGLLFDINVDPANHPPVAHTETLVKQTAFTGDVPVTDFYLNATDLDNPPKSTLQFILTEPAADLPPHTQLLINGMPAGAGSTFTQQDILDNKITFQRTAGDIADVGAYSVRFTLTDGIAVTPLQTWRVVLVTPAQSGGPGGEGGAAAQFPKVDTNLPLSVAEGKTVTISSSQLHTSSSNSADVFTYTLKTAPDPAQGSIYVNGSLISAGGSFTQAQLDAKLVEYRHTGAEVEALTTSEAPFTFDVSNGAYQARNQVFTLNLTPVNDTPAITQTQPALSLSEGATPVPLNVFDVSAYANAIKLTTAQLQDADAEVNAGAGSRSELMYVITAVPGGGNIMVWNGSAWAPLEADGRFSAADVAAGNVAYFHAPTSEPNTATDRVTVYLTDGGSNPDGSATRSGEATVNFTVNNVNDAPVARDSAFTLSEGGTQLLNTSLLAVSDSDADDNTVAGLAARTYAITSLPAHGAVEINRGSGFVTLNANETFTLADINAGKLRYVHDSSENFADSFSYQATDSHSASGNMATFSISVRPVNDIPTVADGYGKVAEGNLLTIRAVTAVPPATAGTLNPDGTGTGDFFKSQDPDNSIEQVQYRLTSSVANGRLYLDLGSSTVTLGVGSAWSFTLADLASGRVKYQHNGTETTSDSFNFTVSDGSGGIEPTGVFHIAITPVNDAPVLTGFGALKNYIEDQPALVIAPGATLADIDLANGAGSFNNGTLTISGATASNDVLAVRNQGSGAGQIGMSGVNVTYNGTAIGTVAGGTGGSPLVISFNAGASVAAVQAVMRNITFVNTDTANPPVSNRSLLFTLQDGGGTDYSGHDTASATVTVTVARVNDAPILAAASPALGTITEDDLATGLTTTVAALVGSTISDVDNGAVQGIAITGLVSGNGLWQYNTGSGWNAIGSVADTGALLLRPADSIRFIPDGKNATTATVTYRAWDQTTGSAGAKADTSGPPTPAPADTSAFSLAHDTATVNVTAVNDAPTGLGNLTLTSIGEDTAIPAGAAINALTGLNFQDVDTGATLAGVAIIGNAANPITEGVWQYATDGNWKAIGTVADGATALALSATTQVRFVPVLNYNGTPPSPTVRALDNTYSGAFSTTSGGTETRVTLDSTVNGGTTPVSTNTNTIGTTVTPVNDPPTLTPDKTIGTPVNEGSPIVISNGSVGLIAVDDIEAARNEGAGDNQGKVSVTITVPNGLAHGKVSLGSITGIAITAGADNSDTLTINGSLADVNLALNGLSFTPGVDTNTSETVTVLINDLGNNGTGATTPLTAAQTITIGTIVPSNNAPVVTRPSTATATEDTPFTFNGVNSISLADGDVRSSDIVELTLNLSSAGTFRFSSATGLFANAAGTTAYILSNEAAGANVVVYGTLANLNAALNALVYTPASNLNSVTIGPDYIGGAFGGHVHFDVTVNDRGYGAGGVVSGTVLSDTKTVDITVNPVNDTPSISGPAASSAYVEQAAPMTIGAGVTVTDSIDDTQLSGATVTISANFRTGDLLAAATAGTSISAAYNAATHVLTLSGVDSITNYNAVLQSVTFSNPSNDAPTSGGATTRTISWQATDNNADGAANGKLSSNAVTSMITITAVSDAPAGTDKIVTTNEDQPYTFKVADFGFTDPLDNPADTLKRVLITTLPANGSLNLNGVPVSAGDYINVTDITGGKLIFVPVPNFNFATTTTTVNPALAIADFATITSTLTISGAPGSISDLNVALNIRHTAVGDLLIKLTAPDGTVQTLFNHSGGSANNLVLTFDDEAARSVTEIPDNGVTTIPGSYRPPNVLSVFDGKSPNGTWTLTVSDTSGGDRGTLNSWSLITATETGFTFQVEDTGSSANGGIILDPSPNTLTINVMPVNDAPALTATAGNPSVTENGTTGGLISIGPVALLNAGSSVADIDLTTTAGLNSTVFGAGSISVSFTDAYVTGDVLFVNGVLPSGVTTRGGTASALTINFAATTTLAQVNSILDAIAYKSTSDNPTVNDTDSARFYIIVINDGNNLQGAPTPNAGGPTALSSNIINGTLTLTRTNDAPVVDLNGAAAGTNNAVTWTEGANVAHTAIAIAPNATLADVDNTNLTQVVMLIGGVANGNNEVLTIGGVDFPLATVAANSAVGSFLVSYNGTNTFTIVPNGASFALATSFQTVIRGITYNNTTDNPSAGNRTVNFTVTDAGYDNGALIGGERGSNTPVASIAVVPANDKPRITDLTPVTYRENAINAAAALIDGNITLTDADSADYNGGTLSVSGLVAGQDTVSLPGAAAALPGNVQINGGTVEYYNGSSWIIIGTASGGVGANFVVTFNANATTAIVERVIENLTFANSSDNPALTRTLKLTVDDGDTGGTLQTNGDLVVTIALDNDAPFITATSLGGIYTEQNETALQFVGGVINVSDPDSPANFFTGGIGSLTVALDTYVSGDTLAVLNQGNAAGQIGVAGTTISFGGLAFAGTSGGNGTPLVITFTSNTATPAAAQALLSQLGYRNTANDDPTVNNTDPSRVFTVTFDDGGNIKNGGPTTALTTELTGTINLIAVNDVPVITPAGQGSYTENAVATEVDNTVTVTDADDSHIAGGTISITGNFLAGDSLAVTVMGNITASYASSTGVLSLSGTDTLANYQTVLRSLTYLNSTDDPTDNTSKATRTLTYSLTDANSDAVGAATGTATRIINVIPQTDAPVLGGAGNTRSYTEDDAAGITLEPALTLNDVDDTHMANATVTLSAGFTAGDILTVSTAGTGIIATYTPGTGVLSLSSSDTTAHYQQVLQSVKFYSTSNDPDAISATRTVTWHTNDANSDSAGTGASNNVTTTISVTALNDAPVAVADTGSTAENVTLTVAAASGVLSNDTDPDSSDTHTVSAVNGLAGNVGGAVTGSNGGSFTIAADGSYTFNPGTAFDYLAAGETRTTSITYTNLDNHGGSASSTLTITVTGSNDIPVAVADTGTTAENAILTVNAAGGVLVNDTDPDSSDTHSVSAVNSVAGNVGTAVTGSNGGSFTIAADGSYSFNPGTAFDYLAAGETRTTSITYTNLDNHGGSASSTLTITVTGSNDVPVAVADTGTTAENVTLTVAAASGVLSNDTDPDSSDTHSVSAVNSVAGNVGTAVTGSNGGSFTIAADGSYTFNPGTAFDTLAAGETRTTSITYTNLDSNGLSASSTLIITVTGANDVPVAVADTGSTAENIILTVNAASGVLANDTDPESSDTHSVSAVNGVTGNVGAAVTGSNGGSFKIAADGSYSFNPGTAFDDLAVGETRTTSVTYTNLDNHGLSASSTLTITVTGSNDAPVAVADTGKTAENVVLTVNAGSGVLSNDTDADSSDTHSVSAVNVGAAVTGSNGGSFTIADDGSYSFNPGTAFDDLAAGEIRTTSVTYTNLDGNGLSAGSTLTITVTGANDAPVAVADTGTTAENTLLTVNAAGGVLANDTDPESSDTHSVSAVNGVTGNVGAAVTGSNGGSFTIAADGSYSFNPGTAFDYLAVGETQTTSVTYTNLDNHGGSAISTLTITVNGTNDAPVADNDNVMTPEDSPIVIDVINGDTDIDGTLDPASVQLGGTAGPGLPLVVAGQGTWSVNTGTGAITFTPELNYNGTPTPITYTVKDNLGLVSNVATVSVIVTPVDDPLTLGGLNDGSVAGTDGSVSESDLATGTSPAGTRESTSGSFTISAPDGIASLQIGSTTLTLAQLLASDVTPQTLVSARGTLVINGYDPGTGAVSYHYTLTSPASSSAPINDSFALTLTDVQGGDTSTANLAIFIIDDAPIAADESDEAINLSGNPSSVATGNVLTGVDAGLATDDPNTTDGITDNLGADGPGTPVITGVGSGLVPLPVTGPVKGVFGTLTLAADGQYTYVPNYSDPAISGLPPNGSQIDTFTYEITDGDGDKSTATLTITIVGTPAIIGLGDGAVTGTDGSVLESNLASGTSPLGLGEVLNGSFLVITPKGLQSLNVAGISILEAGLLASGTTPIVINSANGTLSINGYNATSGVVNYTYALITPANSQTKVSDDFGIFVVDDLGNSTAGVTKDLKIAIIDDAPIANNDSDHVTEDSGLATTGNVVTGIDTGGDSNTTDGIADKIGADVNASPVTAVMAGTAGTPAGGIGSSIAGQYGNLTLNADGSYSYRADNANATVNALPAGGSLNDVFTYQLTDADGSRTSATLTIAIAGVNDAPVAGNDVAPPVVIGNTPSVNVLANDSDAEDGRPTVIDLDPGTPGIQTTFTNADGTFTAAGGVVTFTPANPAFVGSTSLNYVAIDSAGAVSNVGIASFSIIAAPGPDRAPNTAPVAANDSVAQGIPGSNPSVNVLANDRDAEDGLPALIDIDPASPGIQSTFTNADGTFTAAAGGVVTFVPFNSAFTGSTSLNYVAIDSAGAVSNVAVVNFIFSGEVTNNGALIMITNPAPPLFPPFQGRETYELMKYGDSRPFLHNGDVYQSVHFDYRGAMLYLVGSLRNHVVLELRSYSFDVPRWAFQHSNPSEHLEFEATKPDGSPLPKWLRFDPNRLRFTGIPPLGAKTTQVMVTAKDSAGNEVQAYFTVIVNKEPDHPNQRHLSLDVEQPQAAQAPVAKDSEHTTLDKVAGGKAGLTEQIQSAGKLTRLQESRALLDSLKHL